MEFIRVYENAIDESLCDEIIEFYKQNIDNDNDTQCILVNPLNDETKKLNSKLNRKLLKYIKKYIDSIPNNIRHVSYDTHFKKCSLFKNCFIRKIKNNNWCNDDLVYNKAILSFKLCLNTFGEDEGGCIEFNSDKKIRPKKGSLIIYPSHWVFTHRILPTLNDVEHYMCDGRYVDIDASVSEYVEPRINKHVLIKEAARL